MKTKLIVALAIAVGMVSVGSSAATRAEQQQHEKTCTRMARMAAEVMDYRIEGAPEKRIQNMYKGYQSTIEAKLTTRAIIDAAYREPQFGKGPKVFASHVKSVCLDHETIDDL